MTAGALREHTRYDLMELAREGEQFLQRLRRNQRLGDQKARFRSWLSQIDRLVKDGIDARERMALEEGLIALQEFFAGGALSAQDFVGLVARMLGSLQAIRRGSTFKPIEVPDETFARFLRATRFEDEQLGLGADISLADVATTSKLDLVVARRCLARLVDDRLGREGEQNDGFKIEQARVRFALQELDRTPGPAKSADGVPAPVRPVRTGSGGAEGSDPPGVRPLVDIAILTIKEEEFTAVLRAFTEQAQVFVGPKSHRHYNLRSAGAGGDARYRLAIARHEQGNGEALDAARDVLDELQPSLILVVGIAGGRPSDDFTLGDVVLSLRINDYSVHASSPDSETEYDIAGGPVAREIRGGVLNLPARLADLGDWTSGLPIRPPVELDDARFVCPDEWKKHARATLERHFVREPRTAPLFTAGVLGSSDGLIKDANILINWLKSARKLLAVEMESGGVYRATRERCPMLAIRGISDIVGFNRDERWTRYACDSAAAFARAYLQTSPVPPKKATGEPDDDEPVPPDLQRLLDEADELAGQARYRDAREKLLAVHQAAKPGSAAALSAQLDLAELQLFEGTDVIAARDALLGCLKEIRQTDTKRRQNALTLLGDAESLLGHVGEAHSLFTEACRLARERQDRFAEGHALVGLGHAEELRGNLNDAERLINEAIELFRFEYREASDERARRKAATNLAAGFSTRAKLLTHQGALTDAVVCLENALPLLKEANSQDNIGRTLLLKAELLLNEAKWQDGFELLQQAGTIFHAVGNVEWECRCLRHMSRVMEIVRQPDASMAFLSQAISLLSSAPAHQRVPYVLDLARLAWQFGRHDDARARIADAKKLARQGNPDGTLADCFLAEASTVRGEGDSEKAARLSLFESAMRDIEAALARCEIRGRRAVLMERLGSIHGFKEDVREARIWFERALAEFETIGDVFGIARCLAHVAAAARASKTHAEALVALERVVDVTKTLPLYHERAGALHDLALLTLSQRGDVAAARQFLNESRALAEKHNFEDVLEALNSSTELLEHAERLGMPPEKDLGTLISELQAWCALFPAMREGVVPLWYFLHRTELWSICRAMLGVKFLVCTGDREEFDRVFQILRGHGDLFIWARPFLLTEKKETELIPWAPDVHIPPHLSIVMFKKDSELKPNAATAQAVANSLSGRPYVLLPFSKALGGVDCYAFGRHLRLPSSVVDMMLTPTTVTLRQVCMPLGERRINAGEVMDLDEDPVLLRDVMLVAWENGAVPVLVDRLPTVGVVKAVASTEVSLAAPNSPELGAARTAWSNLLRECQTSPRGALECFRDLLNEPSPSGTLSDKVGARAHVLAFAAGTQQINYPAVVLSRESIKAT